MGFPPLPQSKPAPRCGLSIASLILGISGIVLCLGPLAGIPSVICGHMALSRIRKSAGGVSGQGMAVGGLVTGYFSIVWILMIGFIAALALPNFVRAKETAQRQACIANLKSIQAAKEIWALEHKKLNTDVPIDTDLFGPDKNMRDKPLCPAGGTYKLNAVGEKATCSIPEHSIPQ